MAHLVHSNLLSHDNSVMNFSLKGNISEYYNNCALAVDLICINMTLIKIAPSSRLGLQDHSKQWVLNNSKINEDSKKKKKYWLRYSWCSLMPTLISYLIQGKMNSS